MFISLLSVGAYLYFNLSPRTGYTEVVPTETVSLSPAPVLQSLGRVTKYFSLNSLPNGEEYLLKWEAYDLQSYTGVKLSDYANSNIMEPVHLVKRTAVGEEIIEEKLLERMGASSPNGYFKVITQPTNSHVVYFHHGLEGRGGGHRYHLDMITGNIKPEIMQQVRGMLNDKSGCGELDVMSDKQQEIVLICEERERSFGAIYTFDLVNSKLSRRYVLEDSQATFSCGASGYDYYQTRFVSQNEVEIFYCQRDGKKDENHQLPVLGQVSIKVK